MTQDWDDLCSVLVHELCHLHEDHPSNHARYQACLDRVRAGYPDEDESVQFHLLTCGLQRAILMRVFPDRWERMVNVSKGHPVLVRTWQLIETLDHQIDWRQNVYRDLDPQTGKPVAGREGEWRDLM